MTRDRTTPVLFFFATFACALALATGDARAQDVDASQGAITEPPNDEIASESEPAVSVPAPPADAVVPDAPRPVLLVIDAATYGIDPIVGQIVTAALREHGASIGYDVLSSEDSVAAARRVSMPYPPAPAELWRAMVGASAARSAFGRVWAQNGRYVVELVVGSADGGGPFYARDFVGTETLRGDVVRMFAAILPPPGTPTEATPPAGTDALAVAPSTRVTFSLADDLRQQSSTEPAADSPAPRTRRRRRAAPKRWEVVLQTESAIGVTSPRFYNHLVTARLDFRITPQIRIGASMSYVNLAGRDGRIDNLLVMLQAENRVPVAPRSRFSVPLRVGAGYLPFNGPVVRASAGIAWQISDRFDLVADILAPMFWVLPEGVRVSMNLALEAGVRF